MPATAARLGHELRQSLSVGRSFAAYGLVAARSRWTPARLTNYQQAQLSRLLASASGASPFLRNRRPDNPLDLRAWPLISRAEIQNQPLERLLAPGFTATSCTALATTGSSGQPLRMYFSKRDLRRRWLYFMRMFRAYGLPFLCRLVQIENYRQSRIHPRGDWATWDRRSFLSVCDSVDRRLDLLVEADPEAIIGFSADLAEMGGRARERGMVFPALRVVMGVGDVMTEEHRADISKGFGAPVRDFYGAVEAGLIGFECPAGTGMYHVNADNILVEIVEDGREAITGEVVITHLGYEAMPLIRYRLGDIATRLPQCACGSGLPALEGVHGRTDDVLTLSSGRKLTPRRVTCLFCDSGLRRFRIRQHAAGDFTLEVDADFRETEDAERRLRSVLDAGDRLTVHRMALPRSSRKERNIVVERA